MKALVVFCVCVFMVLLDFPGSEAGFGCPFNSKECNKHCKLIKCTSGYCDWITGWIRCTCKHCPRGRDIQAGTSSLTCDFENPNLCGYTQDKTDVFDWTRGSGQTTSGGTGPINDHTYSTKTGHYMYIEASVPRRQGDIARLISQSYSPSAGAQCVEFWYNMYGVGTGTLNVYMQVGGNRGNPKFTKQGNQGNQWFRAEVGVPAGSQPFQLVFEGIRGSSYTGDIAIDDVAVKTGSCGASPETMVLG